MKKFQPTISIITVVYNGADLLESTIQSVLLQSYPAIEYLIVDGASTDKTVEIIKRYEGQIGQWVSEPDKGLYDAMNKGLRMATGDFVWFMNAGDTIAEAETLEKVVAAGSAETDIFFGEVLVVDEQGQALGTRSEISTQRLPEQLDWKSLQRGMVVCHQAFLPRISITSPYIPNNLSADIDWVINCLKKSRQNTHTHLLLAHYLAGGLSKKRHRESLWDRYAVLKNHYGFLPNLFNHLLIVLRAGWSKFSRRGKATY